MLLRQPTNTYLYGQGSDPGYKKLIAGRILASEFRISKSVVFKPLEILHKNLTKQKKDCCQYNQ